MYTALDTLDYVKQLLFLFCSMQKVIGYNSLLKEFLKQQSIQINNIVCLNKNANWINIT